MEQAGIALTEQFYQWEQRGRGWLVAPAQADIEPPFHPFFGHHLPKGYIDDGRRSTWLSELADQFRQTQKPNSHEVLPFPDIDFIPSPAPKAVRTLQLSFPKNFQAKIERLEQLLVMLTCCRYHLSFEIIATDRTITLQLVSRESDFPYVRSQLEVFFPECLITEQSDELCIHDGTIAVVDLGLAEEFMRPIGTYKSGEYDSYASMFGVLEHIGFGEQVVLQVLFSGAINPWTTSIHTAISDGRNGSFFWNAPEMPKLAHEKTACPLYGVCIKLSTLAPIQSRANALLRTIVSVITLSTSSDFNRFIELSNATYDSETQRNDMLERQSHRIGMLLNVRELMNIVHFPSAQLRSTKLTRIISMSKAAPARTTIGEYVLGKNTHRNVEQIVHLSTDERLQHIHIIGATGTGKSTLLSSLIYQDIKLGNGIAVVDPHGDLIDLILKCIPQARIKDVVIIDPSDTEYAVGFNMLHAHSPLEQELLSSDLVALFRRFATSWGDQMNSVLANAIMAILASKDGGTLIDLRRFLIEKPFREKVLTTVTDHDIVYYWQYEYPLLKSSSLGSILTRLDTFLRPRVIRAMVSQRKSLHFNQLMDEKKIVLIKLSQGLIGAENSFILGASIVAKFQQAAMARQSKDRAARTPYFLYIDEFHHFATPSMQSILSGARKYGLGLIIAHQSMSQLTGENELASAVIANTGTRICFRLGDNDAKRFAESFANFNADHLQNLGLGEAIARIGRAEDDFSLQSIAIPTENLFDNQEAILDHSRSKYSTPITLNTTPLTPIVPTKDIISSIPIQLPESVEHISEQLVLREQGRKHRYLQTLIKKMAEERGFKAQIEMPIQNGNGKVDVALSRNSQQIAVELSVSTGIKWEMHNIEKCFAAGYQTVCWCSSDTSALQKMRALVEEKFDSIFQKRIIISNPERLFEVLDPIPIVHQEQVIKGYRVTVAFESPLDTERMQKEQTVKRILRKP
ncbi:MAG: type IV secretory system conjugative DNA transfer family protein [Candidatus Pacearchaeota archaeon]